MKLDTAAAPERVLKRPFSNGIKRKSRSFLESAPDATLIISKAGRIALVNSQTEKLFGYRRKELRGKQFELLIPGGRMRLLFRDKEDFFQIPRPGRLRINSRLEGIRKNGEKVELDISLSPLQ